MRELIENKDVVRYGKKKWTKNVANFICTVDLISLRKKDM